MKGVIFNALESFVDESFGEGTFDSLVELSLPDEDGVYVGPQTYPDEQLFAIITKALEVKKLELDPVLRGFGKYLFGILSSKYPDFVTPHDNAKDFIKTIHDVIHVEVRKLFPDAVTPAFFYSGDEEGKLTLRYESERNLFALAEGLIDGAAEHYKETIQIDRKEANPSKNYCIFDLQFTRAA